MAIKDVLPRNAMSPASMTRFAVAKKPLPKDNIVLSSEASNYYKSAKTVLVMKLGSFGMNATVYESTEAGIKKPHCGLGRRCTVCIKEISLPYVPNVTDWDLLPDV